MGERTKKPFLLVVEDDADTRELYSLAFPPEEYDFISTASGKDGIREVADADQCPLVLLDMTLPDMDGLEFVEQLRKEKHGADAKVILVSGWGDVDQIAVKAGAWGHLRKPFDLGDLFQIVDRALA